MYTYCYLVCLFFLDIVSLIYIITYFHVCSHTVYILIPLSVSILKVIP